MNIYIYIYNHCRGTNRRCLICIMKFLKTLYEDDRVKLTLYAHCRMFYIISLSLMIRCVFYCWPLMIPRADDEVQDINEICGKERTRVWKMNEENWRIAEYISKIIIRDSRYTICVFLGLGSPDFHVFHFLSSEFSFVYRVQYLLSYIFSYAHQFN